MSDRRLIHQAAIKNVHNTARNSNIGSHSIGMQRSLSGNLAGKSISNKINDGTISNFHIPAIFHNAGCRAAGVDIKVTATVHRNIFSHRIFMNRCRGSKRNITKGVGRKIRHRPISNFHISAAFYNLGSCTTAGNQQFSR